MSNPFITSYATPYHRAKALLAEFLTFASARSYALPAVRYAQVGDIKRDCAAVIVAATNLVPDPQYDPVDCIAPRSSTFLVEIIRACAITYDRTGLTVPDNLEAISESAADDGQILYDFAAETDGWSSKQPWSVVWSLDEGGLQVASLQLTIGVP
jgi:hypothetical protein